MFIRHSTRTIQLLHWRNDLQYFNKQSKLDLLVKFTSDETKQLRRNATWNKQQKAKSKKEMEFPICLAVVTLVWPKLFADFQIKEQQKL